MPEHELHALIAEWIKCHNIDELLASLEKEGVPSSKINSIADIFKDPHFKARENIIEAPLPSGKKIKTMGVVPKLSLTPGRVDFVAPSLGTANEEVYLDLLGLSREEYLGYKERGII